MSTSKPFVGEPLQLNAEFAEPGIIDFVEDGPASKKTIGLAINEFDPTMASNINFKHPDCIKLLTTDSGLEEMRTLVHYQIMHKQALIVAIRTNQAILEQHMRAQAELIMVKEGHQAIPNMILPLDTLYSPVSEEMDEGMYYKIKRAYDSNLNDSAGPCLLHVKTWK
jgi:hypothetical protein